MIFPASFGCWRKVVDFYLLANSGRVTADLPVPDGLLREAWRRGWRAEAVGLALSGPAARVPRATLSRWYCDSRVTIERERVLARVGG